MSGHTKGVASVGNGEADAECVVMVGERQILECYEDGESQNEEDQANALHVAKTWNAYPKLIQRTKQRAAFLRLIAGRIPPPLQQMVQEALYSEAASDEALLRELGEKA